MQKEDHYCSNKMNKKTKRNLIIAGSVIGSSMLITAITLSLVYGLKDSTKKELRKKVEPYLENVRTSFTNTKDKAEEKLNEKTDQAAEKLNEKKDQASENIHSMVDYTKNKTNEATDNIKEKSNGFVKEMKEKIAENKPKSVSIHISKNDYKNDDYE
jgi:ElaB/YqjD/DUF883 family membrane-anchored ribosome-binding protein